MIANDYPLGFKVALHRKDLAIALALARELGVSLPGSSLVAALEDSLVGRGHGEEDQSSIARIIRGLSGLED
jgi:3-hydroxyisobutyrate dehydrogenase-like beta-hydroxyacid dehydrogenase